MKPLLFGIHCHQPVDNFSFVLENAIQKCYKPFFQTLQRYPNVVISVHFSGWLLEYVKKNDAELFALMQSLSNQIEFFSGGFYEPILISLSKKDRIDQINRLNRYILKHFGQKPKGLWLTERVWDNALIDDLCECGIKYVVVDDYHFHNSFYDDLNGYYVTSSGENTLGLFAISQTLRYEIPFKEVENVMQTLLESQNLNVIFDDGEKFGVWPKTYESVYEKKWLEQFFESVTNTTALQPQTFREFYESNPPLGLCYLAPASYKEMGLWSLSYEAAKEYKMLAKSDINERFLKGGLWQNFFNKYQESNWIHKRVLALSTQNDSKKYKNFIQKAQCNDVLWHGVFGGIYLPNLRDNAYRYIIECEKMLQNRNNTDIDLDGQKEYRLQNESFLALFHTNGGQLYEFDLLEDGFNLANTVTRYKEHYHDDIVVGSDESRSTIHKDTLYVSSAPKLHYDWYLKKSSIDHISDESFTLERFEQNGFNEYGDFANQPFAAKLKNNRLIFTREGGIYKQNTYAAKLKKSFTLKNNTLFSNVHLSSNADETLYYANEYNLHFCDYDALYFNGERLKEGLHLYSTQLVIDDNVLQKRFCFDFGEKIDIFACKLETITQSEEGIETTIQGVSLAFVKHFSNSCEFNLSFSATAL